MRNLKRALSLAMASVMLLGMMVVGAGAKGYDDVKETDNVEAIEVLQAIEVMVGDERGFGPDRPVNRAEMAVVMGLLLNLDYNYYSATCPFNDVYDWARGWVGACAANGIVSGRGDGVYDPGATVTAVEGASMLMRALGYFKYPSDYADGFEVSTVRQGTTIGIFDGVGSSATEPMTRNQVAQMVLNALKSGMVQPDGNTLNYFDNNGNIIATGGKINYVYVTSNKAFARSISDTQATSMGSTNNSPIVELGEQLYDGELKLYGESENNRRWDAFGRPARIWEFKGQEIGTYVKKELLKQEYTAKVTGQNLYELLTKNTVDNYNFRIAIDGVYTDEVASTADLLGAYFSQADLYRTNKDAVGRTGNGVLTQVFVDTDFVDKDDYAVYIAVINTYLAKATEDYDSKNDDVNLRIWRLDKMAGANEYVKSNVKDSDTTTTKKSDNEELKAKGEDFTLVPEVKKDDLYLVTVAQGEIQTIKAPEVLSAVTVNSFKLYDHVTTGGQTYNHNTTARYDVEAIEDWTGADGTLNLKELTYNIVLDDYGYLIGLERNEDPAQYVFLTGIEAGASNLYAKQVDANVIHMDGTMETIKVDMTKSVWGAIAPIQNLRANYSGNLSQMNTWCTYSVNNNGVYTLRRVPVATTTNVTSDTVKAGQFAQDVAKFFDAGETAPGGWETKSINTKRVSLKASESASQYVYGNDDTVYLTVSLEKVLVDDITQGTTYDKATSTDIAATVGAQRWIIDDVETVATGVKNVNLVATDLGMVKDSYGYPDGEVYTLYDNDGIVIAAVVIGEDDGASSSYAYIHSSGLEEESYQHGSETKSGDGEWTWTRKAIVNGVETLLKEYGDNPQYLHPQNSNYPYGMVQGYWYEIKYSADGNVRRAERITNAPANTKYPSIVQGVEESVNTSDTVVLLDTTTVDKLSYKNGTLYTNTNATKGFSVDPDVKTVLILAGKQGSGSYGRHNVKLFDSTTDGYTGYAGLQKAIDEMNYNYYSGTAIAGDIEIAAILENGRATTIIINDELPAPDNKPNGGNKPGTETGKLTITDADNSGYISTPANGATVKAGDIISITVNSGYKAVAVKGANAPVVNGNVYMFTATGSTVEIKIEPVGGVVTNPKTLTLAGTFATASDVQVWNADGTKQYDATVVPGMSGNTKTYTIPGDAVVQVKSATVLATNGSFTVNGETLTVKDGVVKITMNDNKTLKGDDFASASKVFTLTVEDGITIEKFEARDGSDKTSNVKKEDNVYYVKAEDDIVKVKVKTTDTDYAFITTDPAQGAMPKTGPVNTASAKTTSQEITLGTGTANAYVVGATKVNFNNINTACFGYSNNSYGIGNDTNTNNGSTWKSSGEAYIRPGVKLAVSIDISDDLVSAAIVQVGTTAVNVANDRVHNGYEIGNEEVTLKGAFKVTLNGVKAKVGSVDIADGLYYVAKGQKIESIAAVDGKGTAVLKDGKVSNTTSEASEIANLAAEVTLDAAVTVTTSGTWTGVNSENDRGDKSPITVTSNSVVVKTGTKIAAQADDSTGDITVNKDSVTGFEKDGNWVYFTLGVKDITLKQGT